LNNDLNNTTFTVVALRAFFLSGAYASLSTHQTAAIQQIIVFIFNEVYCIIVNPLVLLTMSTESAVFAYFTMRRTREADSIEKIVILLTLHAFQETIAVFAIRRTRRSEATSIIKIIFQVAKKAQLFINTEKAIWRAKKAGSILEIAIKTGTLCALCTIGADLAILWAFNTCVILLKVTTKAFCASFVILDGVATFWIWMTDSIYEVMPIKAAGTVVCILTCSAGRFAFLACYLSNYSILSMYNRRLYDPQRRRSTTLGSRFRTSSCLEGQ
jgi:hypothetical protein